MNMAWDVTASEQVIGKILYTYFAMFLLCDWHAYKTGEKQ